MAIVLSVLIVLAAILLILVVLIQNPKGGGIASNFSAGNNIMGVRKTSDFIEKLTWGLAIGIIVLTLSSGLFYEGTGSDSGAPESNIQEEVNSSAPAMPQNPVPQNGGAQEEPSAPTE